MHRTCSWLFGVSASILEESGTDVYMYNIVYVKNNLKTVSKNFSILCDNFCQFCSHVYTRVKLFEIWTLRCLLEVGVIQ